MDLVLRRSDCQVASQVANMKELADTTNSKQVMELVTGLIIASGLGPLNDSDGPS